MPGPKLDEVTVHRLFRTPDAPRPPAAVRRAGPPQAGLGPAGGGRAYPAWKSVAGHLTDTALFPPDGGDFRRAATPWELEWSTLCGAADGTGFRPVVEPVADGYAMVVAHLGWVRLDNLVTNDRRAADPVAAFEGGTGLAFVCSPAAAPPDGWYWTRGAKDYRNYQVLAAPDGEVLAFGGYSAGNNGTAVAMDVTPLDLILGVRVLVGLGAKLGARLIAVYARRKAAGGAVARTLQLGPTRQLAAAAEEATAAEAASGLRFQVLAEGPPVAGTAVPESLRLRVGAREFDIGRNAAKVGPDAGQQIGPATKHLAEEVKGAGWDATLRVKDKAVVRGASAPPIPESNVWLRAGKVDFPMSSLASGLQEAERRILAGAVQPTAAGGRVFHVTVQGWEFMIDTGKTAWRVFHAQVLR